jgi:hypothetical protein
MELLLNDHLQKCNVLTAGTLGSGVREGIIGRSTLKRAWREHFIMVIAPAALVKCRARNDLNEPADF